MANLRKSEAFTAEREREIHQVREPLASIVYFPKTNGLFFPLPDKFGWFFYFWVFVGCGIGE